MSVKQAATGSIPIVLTVSLIVSGAVAMTGQGFGPAQGGRAGQGERGQAPGGRGQPQANLPSSPTPVALPEMSAEITGPGPMFNSTPSLPPGKGLDSFHYEAKEYFIKGTANGQPYHTRIVVRKPAMGSFSGLVLVEAMHGSGAAHMFEFTSTYTMSSGHAAIEILTTSPMQFVQQNEARYRDLRVAAGQANEIIAQAGALVRSGRPLGGAAVRKMVMSGTSMSAGVLINYLPAHMVYRTPDMQRIFDGFMPTSSGATVPDVDVPVIQMPTMHEVSGANITSRQDGDEAGKQYRLYEVAGIAHIDTRDSVRMKPNPCAQPLSEFPHQAYMALGLHHLFQWVDKGIAPPRAERMWLDRDEFNDGSRLALDEHGNPRGGIRNPYVDVPTAKYVIRPPAITPVIPNGSPYIANGGQAAANQMCGLSGAQLAFSQAKLKDLYKNKRTYVGMVDRRLTELERAGWSLAVYRDLILSDAAKVSF